MNYTTYIHSHIHTFIQSLWRMIGDYAREEETKKTINVQTATSHEIELRKYLSALH